MNRSLVVRFATALLALAMLAVPAQAMAGKGKGKSKKPLVVCKHGCKYKTIQSAVDKAKKGGTINVLKGKYVEGVVFEGHKYDGLTIQGMEQKKKKNKKTGKVTITYKKADPAKVVLEGKNAKTPDGSTANNGIEAIDVNGLRVMNMTARNYGANGFFVRDSDPKAPDNTIECNDYLFKNDIASFNRSYGFYAFGCAGGRFTKSTGYGHGDSAFYVGATPPQGDNPKITRIDHVNAYENVLGFSGTNSRYMLIEDSNWFNNGVGLVPNTLDSEPFEPNADGVIRNNDIYWNNFNYFLPNSRVATVSDGLGEIAPGVVIQYPTGAGVVLLGSTGWTVESNNIFGNFKWGAAVISDPFNEGDNAISKNNQFLNNNMGRDGTDTNGTDFFNQGSGVGNCFSGAGTVDPSPSATNAQLYPACPTTDAVNAGQTGDSQGNLDQFLDLAGYVTTTPPEKQECDWTKHPHPSPYEGNEPLEVTPGPAC